MTHAAWKLAADLGPNWTVVTSASPTPAIVVDAGATGLSGEVYRLTGSGATQVLVQAGSQAGAVNGVHGLRRRLRERGVTAASWSGYSVSTTVTPNFVRRGVMVAPYGFGGQQNVEAFGCDTWGIAEWKEYVDYLRLLNANVLELFPIRMWHPDRPETFLEGARYEVWHQVLEYCHEVGMEFHWVMLLNQVTPGFWWDNPALRVGSGWQGTAASFALADQMSPNPLVAEQDPTYVRFADADAFVFMWNDGGAADYGPLHMANPARNLMRQVLFAHDRMVAAGSRARVVVWGWLQEPWYYLAGHVLPTFHTDSVNYLSPTNLPFTVEWLQESDRLYSTFFPGWPLADPFATVQAAGITDVTDFLYLNHVEEPREVLPNPRLLDTVRELRWSAGGGATGAIGYRLSPGTRHLNDYVTLRAADDIDFGASEAVNVATVTADLAAFLTRGDLAATPTVAAALSLVDAAHPQHVGGTLTLSSASFVSAWTTLQGLTLSNPDLDRWRHLLGFQAGVLLWIEALGTPNEASSLMALWGWVQGKRIFRGFTTQNQFDPEGMVRMKQFAERVWKSFG